MELTSALNTILSDALSPRTRFPSVPAAKVTTPTKNELPVTDNPAPTVRLPAIPAPPSICTAPVLTLPRVFAVISSTLRASI